MTTATVEVTEDHRYVGAGDDFDLVHDLHTGDVLAGDVAGCNSHWRRQVLQHGSVKAALAAYDTASASAKARLAAWCEREGIDMADLYK